MTHTLSTPYASAMILRDPNPDNRDDGHNRRDSLRRMLVGSLAVLVTIAATFVAAEPASGRVLRRFLRSNRSCASARVAAPEVKSGSVGKAESAEAKGGGPDAKDFVATCTSDNYLDYRPWLRDQDSMYLVDTRCLGCPCCYDDVLDLPIYRYEPGADAWQPATLDQLVHDAADSVTSIHIHGNRIDAPVAIRRGWAVYHEWVRRDAHGTRLTFVVWSWPSSQIRGQLRDVRAKAARTTFECVYLARLLAGLPADARISLTGHSYGARIICGATHLLAGCDLSGYRLEGETAEPPRNIRAVLTAAAMHNYWLSPGCYLGCALTQMEHVLNLYNSCDPALRFYRFIERGSKPAALGYTGSYFCGDGNGRAHRVEDVNVVGVVGKEHSFLYYLCSPEIIDMSAPYVLFQPVD
jgi:hypothetical protein